MTPQGSERRLFPRVPPHCAVLVEALDARQPWLSGPAEDLSPGGCQILLEQRLRLGQPIRLTLHLSARVVKAEGFVAHVEAARAGGWETGVSFLRIAPEGLCVLRRALGRQ